MRAERANSRTDLAAIQRTTASSASAHRQHMSILGQCRISSKAQRTGGEVTEQQISAIGGKVDRAVVRTCAWRDIVRATRIEIQR